MADYALFLGCLIPMKLPQIEAASRSALTKLGIKLQDLEGFSCCPEPWNFKGADVEAWLKVAGRNLAVAEAKGADIITLCNGCSATLMEAGHLLGNGNESAKQALKDAGYKYEGKTKAHHAVTILDKDKVAASCSRKLNGLKVAVHYGCHLLRPSDVMATDDPFEPTFLDELVEATGAESIAYNNKMACCGSASHDKEVSLGIARDKITAMEAAGADCLVVTCPACFDQFDMGQVEMNRKLKEDHKLPVLHYFQLLAIAQGESAEKLGFSKHKIKTDPVLKAVAK
jgi:heterodisulfide reductase subunit B2